MKYIDADSIKDEIKHLKIDVYDESHQFDLGARCSLTFLESFIDSLQQEQPEVFDTFEEPVSEDLEEAADEYASRYDAWNDNQDIAEYAFKAGAEWQKRKMMEGATYNELMELYRAIRDELVKRHCDVPVNIKEEQ